MTQILPKYEQIDHTADVGIKIYGSTVAQLFEHAALGLFDVIANLETVTPNSTRNFTVEASDREALLVNWLSELNYSFFTRCEIYKTFEVTRIDATKLSAQVVGEKLDPDRHEIYTEVKAVTYHHLYVRETTRGWEAQVIFDL